MPSYTPASFSARVPHATLLRVRRAVAPVLFFAGGVLGAVLPRSEARAQSSAAAPVSRTAEPTTYAELWNAAAVAVDQGEFERNATTRGALYAKATAYARRAVALNPADAEGHFHLARAIGQTALAASPRERVKYGVEVREQALEALRITPKHPGALHVMGVWHAEIMRLNGFTRAIAKTFLGGQVFSSASWAEAARYLERAVQQEPDRLVHRLDLARVYRDMGRIPDARSTYQSALSAPSSDANDGVYRQQAGDEMRRLPLP